jgi:nucleotide-binding universal stress UspA family protein
MKSKTVKKQAIKFMPAQMKKVIIALDYEPSAQKVAETGYSLAKSMRAGVVLLHIIDEITYYSSIEYSPIMGFSGFSSAVTPNLIDIEKVKKASKKFLDKSKQHLCDDTIEVIVEEGDTADTIIKTANNLRADLIVVGTHSRRGLEKILMGSVAEKILHNTSIPLFIVPTRKDK